MHTATEAAMDSMEQPSRPTKGRTLKYWWNTDCSTARDRHRFWFAVWEHLKFASNSGVILHLCKLLTVCFQFGLVPTSFTKGILIPILKKPTQDPSQPKNYRPIIVSNIISKIIELYILYECNDHKFSEFQFGFVTGRGSISAAALVHDVASYFNAKGSTIVCAGWMWREPLMVSPILFCFIELEMLSLINHGNFFIIGMLIFQFKLDGTG